MPPAVSVPKNLVLFTSHKIQCASSQIGTVQTFTIFSEIIMVENIGDSFVKESALAEPSRHHAAKMAKFVST
jgi:hypothetical protein